MRIIVLILMISMVSCKSDKTDEIQEAFVLHGFERTGISFSNDLDVNLDLNIFNYMYYYNGAGVAVADFNNDDRPDIYFTSNLGKEELYLNEGNLKFRNVSEETNVDAGEGGWTTGAAVVDINNDGLLDIYICQVGKYRALDARNKLLVCTGIDDAGVPQYKESAADYGLDFQGFSTQAGFFDYDLDGDLDMYLMNHSLHHNGTFGQRKDFLGTVSDVSGDRLYRNDNGKYVDVSREAGIESSVIGYGLGLAFGDVNLDGLPDIYVGNDFHENDYLYINQGDGTFVEDIENQMMHTSRFSMGVDIADVNNDMYPDIISLDMLPEDPVILKMSEGEDAINIFNFKLSYGYNWQYAKNCLQLNNGNNSFSDVAMYSGVHATDWSWSPMFFDMDLDGSKDLFISNGIPRRMNDIDYINYMAGNEIQQRIQFDELREEDLVAIDKIPEIKLKNKLFLSNENLKFKDLENAISGNKISYSNSAAFADFDNDGDYDIVVNNINEEAFVYENKLGNTDNSLRIKIEGPKNNKSAQGAKVIVGSKNNEKQYFEVSSTRGFQSSMIGDLLVGDRKEIETIDVIWPDGTYEHKAVGSDSTLTFTYKAEYPKYDLQSLRKKPVATLSKSKIAGLSHSHKENPFTEFHRETLIPHQTSDHGPALAVGDLNGDGLEDVFVGSSKFEKHGLYYQNSENGFEKQGDDILNLDYGYEEVDAMIVDVNGDGMNDLIIATGGNEWRLTNKYTEPLLYINKGNGALAQAENAFKGVNVTACGVSAADFDNDGDIDIVLGSRATPWTYGEVSRSYYLANDGKGNFSDMTDDVATGLSDIGMVKSTTAADIDNDGDQDLVVAVEWDGIYLFRNNGKRLIKETLTDKKGWWNFAKVIDYDSDGDQDIVLGNLGQNTRLKASDENPLRMYVNDFDDNGKKEQILTYYIDDREVIFSNLLELQKSMPFIKDKYQYAKDFAKASVSDVFGKEKINSSIIYTANYMDNALLRNEGGNYSLESLPTDLQRTPYYDAIVSDINDDGNEDLFLVGNYYGSNIQLGRYDADNGALLINTGAGAYEKVKTDGVKLNGANKYIKKLSSGEFIISVNNDSLEILNVIWKGK